MNLSEWVRYPIKVNIDVHESVTNVRSRKSKKIMIFSESYSWKDMFMAEEQSLCDVYHGINIFLPPKNFSLSLSHTNIFISHSWFSHIILDYIRM